MTDHVGPSVITRADLESLLLAAKGAIVVDIWAPWCMPCRMMAPVLAKLAVEFAGTLTIVKLNYDDNRDLKAKYGFEGIPALLFFNDGQLIQQSCGFGGYGPTRKSFDDFVATVTGQPTPAPSPAEQLFLTADAAAEQAYEGLTEPAGADFQALAKPLWKNVERVKKRAKKALEAGLISQEQNDQRVKRSTDKYDAKTKPDLEAYQAIMARAEAAYVDAIEAATGIFSEKPDGDSAGAVCEIGDKTCRI